MANNLYIIISKDSENLFKRFDSRFGTPEFLSSSDNRKNHTYAESIWTTKNKSTADNKLDIIKQELKNSSINPNDLEIRFVSWEELNELVDTIKSGIKINYSNKLQANKLKQKELNKQNTIAKQELNKQREGKPYKKYIVYIPRQDGNEITFKIEARDEKEAIELVVKEARNRGYNNYMYTPRDDGYIKFKSAQAVLLDKKFEDSSNYPIKEVKNHIEDFIEQWFNNDFDEDIEKYGDAFDEIRSDDYLLTKVANKLQSELINEDLDLYRLRDVPDVNYFIYNILKSFANKKTNLKDHYGDGELQKERSDEKDDFYVIIEGSRDGYGIDQVEDNTMTVDDLIGYLSQFPGNTKVVIGNDFHGSYYYTYGAINDHSIASMEIIEPEEEEEYEEEEDYD